MTTLRRLSGHPPSFDLQSHSDRSDGELAPGDVVRMAARAGVELLSLTDHDSVEGLPEAGEAAREQGMRLLNGVEISTLDQSHGDLHVLGYRVDAGDPTLQQRLRGYRQYREDRADAMAQALQELGFVLEHRILRERRARGDSVGRPHLAQAVVSHPANADRLAREGRTDPTAFLVAYLTEGAPAFRARRAPSVAEAIGVIHDAGGVAVWAHPFWDVSASDEVAEAIDRFAAAGLDGVECFYPTHDQAQTDLLVAQCERRGLLTTGSADFHGPGHSQFSRFRAFSTYGHKPVLGPLAG